MNRVARVVQLGDRRHQRTRSSGQLFHHLAHAIVQTCIVFTSLFKLCQRRFPRRQIVLRRLFFYFGLFQPCAAQLYQPLHFF